MANKKNKARGGRKASTKSLQSMRLKFLNEKKARHQLDHQDQEQEVEGNANANGPNLNQDQSFHNLTGYNLSCCPNIDSTDSRSLKAYSCSKCLQIFWFHSSCISQPTSDDQVALKNKQWVCFKCKDQVIVEQNEMKKRALDEVGKKMLEAQNIEKLMALQLIDDLKSMNKAIEMKLEEISKWVENKFADMSIPEKIETETETEDDQNFEYTDINFLMEQSLSEISPIELNRIRSGIGGKRSEKLESTMKNRSGKISFKSRLEKHDIDRGLPMGSFLEIFKMGVNEASNNVHSSKNTLTKSGLFKCPRENCEREFGLEHNLQTHIKFIHDKVNDRIMKVICQHCGKYIVNKYELRKHIKHVHEKIKRPDLNVICHYCGKSLVNGVRLRQHIKRIHELGPERFECPEENCSKRFASKMRLETHIATHDEPEEYLKCTEEGCLKRFKNKKSLKYHLEIHAAKGVRNFACPMCDKTFVTRNCLAAHKRMSHAKEINHEFKCTFEGCNLGYSVRKYLEDHLKTHDPNYLPLHKQKLIICQFCAKEYETFPQLNRHILNVHEK